MIKSNSLPGWLTREDNYIPGKDKDAFIDKSILSVLGALSRIRAQSALRESKYRANAIFKLTFTLLLVILLSITQSFAFVFIAVVATLCRISLMRASEIARLLKVSIAASLFTAIVLLPAVLFGNWYSIEMITPKVFVSVTAIGLLSHRTRWNELTSALKYFFIPDIFIFVLDIAIKYILLLGELTLNMLYALKLRSVGRSNRKRASLSGVAGSMFLHSRELAAEMHSAMMCRGFTGEYRRPLKFKLNSADVAMATVAMATLVLFLYLR